MSNLELVKVVMVGDGAVGKTAALLSFALGKIPGEYVPTVFDNYTVDVPVEEGIVKLALFDTAGQEDYDSVISRSSFQNIKYKWVPELRSSNPQTPIILVGTQSDLRNDKDKLLELQKKCEKPIDEEEALSLAKDLKLQSYKECSALTSEGLKGVFDEALIVGLNGEEIVTKKPCCVLF